MNRAWRILRLTLKRTKRSSPASCITLRVRPSSCRSTQRRPSADSVCCLSPFARSCACCHRDFTSLSATAVNTSVTVRRCRTHKHDSQWWRGLLVVGPVCRLVECLQAHQLGIARRHDRRGLSPVHLRGRVGVERSAGRNHGPIRVSKREKGAGLCPRLPLRLRAPRLRPHSPPG